MKYLALDIGNVILHIDTKPFIQLFVDYNIFETYEEAHDFSESMMPRFDTGISNLKWELNNLRNFDMKLYPIFKDTWSGVVKQVPQINEILNNLFERNKNIALLSNIGTDHKQVALTIPNINNYIRHFSCDVGVRKPNKLYFYAFNIEYNEAFPLDNRYCLYLDDRQENLNAASKLFGSLKTEHFDISKHANYDDAAKEFNRILHKHFFNY